MKLCLTQRLALLLSLFVSHTGFTSSAAAQTAAPASSSASAQPAVAPVGQSCYFAICLQSLFTRQEYTLAIQ
ncbi:hypothetical protein [Prosthecobacter vanneervenii]|uniref:Uncharacterized protein n=1 Tax=Prosthecobacter vanneervenii TaxID=48466 RepID=A0A7W7Y7D3_9BACT|nr:hypothetical protein [Prosthecobacter vanneervenii]MBB5030600.1 hypothetical protein [Prosthecobacter vanneervenii]